MEKITLPVQALVELYGQHLYYIPENQPQAAPPVTTIETKTTAIASLGGNTQQVLLLVNDTEATHIEAEALETITKILGACKLTLADVAIVNVYQKEISWAGLKTQFNPRQCLLLGVSPEAAGLPMVFPPYHPHQYDACQFVLSVSAQALAQDNLQKSKLWLCLKTLFQL
jgi:hypothetical protein